jgi:hypothetical protein
MTLRESLTRVFIDLDYLPESKKALRLLGKAGFLTITVPSTGLRGPAIKNGVNWYKGIEGIKKFIKINKKG